MMDILPAILAHDEEEFHDHLFHPGLRAVAPVFHIDILDNTLVRASAWADPIIIGGWSNLPAFELHLMVQDPLSHLKQWRAHVPGVRRAIVQAEVGQPLPHILKTLHTSQLETLLALHPDTPCEAVAPYRSFIRGVQIMGVVPGKSGQAFLGEPVLAKMRRMQALFPGLFLSLDGGVSLNNIQAIAQAGASRCVASSALWQAENPEEALKEFYNRLH